MSPSQFGQYQIKSLLGEGAVGIVYLAKNRQGETVALKLIKNEILEKSQDGQEIKDRFKREAKYSFKLSHPNIVKVFDAGEISGSLYIVYEFIKGYSLADILQRSPLSEAHTLEIAKQALFGLSEFHKNNLIHRDIKPANILISEDGLVKISDFGLLRSTEANETKILTKIGTTVGTPCYMPPEQIYGSANLDIRCDLYALGIVIYECLCGHPPFQGDTVTDILRKHLAQEIPQLTRDNVDPQISKLINWLLAKKTEQRPQTPKAVLHYLENQMTKHPDSNLQVLVKNTSRGPKTTVTSLETSEMRVNLSLAKFNMNNNHTLFMFSGSRLKIKSGSLEQKKQKVLFPWPAASKDYYTLFVHDNKVYIVDMKTTEATVDGRRLSPDVPYELTQRHIVRIGKDCNLVLRVISPPPFAFRQVKFNAKINHSAPSVFIRAMHENHSSYALVPGKILLDMDLNGTLQPSIKGKLEIISAADSLWVSQKQHKQNEYLSLIDGFQLTLKEHTVSVSSI